MDGTLLGTIAAIGMLCAYQLCGYVLMACALPHQPWHIRTWLGSVLGLVLMMWMPALFAFPMQFTIPAHITALVVTVVVTAAVAMVLTLRFHREIPLRPQTFSGMVPLLLCVLPILILFTYLFWHHTLRPVGEAIHTGQSGYGDMSMHLSFVTSLARQQIFPPQYSIRPGVELGYPFLSDQISASLYLFGMPLRLSYVLPGVLAGAQVLTGFFFLTQKWLGKTRYAVLAFWIFFLGGGFGFAYFMDGLRDNPWNFTRIFTAFYETPTNYIEQNIRWVNPIADLMLPQRATLFGWALLLPCLYFLYELAMEKKRDGLILGLFAGALPMIHTHSFLALGIFSATLLGWDLLANRKLKDALVRWGPYALMAMLLALPQMLRWTFAQSAEGDFLRLHFNWGNINDNYIWFYVKNIGLTGLLTLPALLAAPKEKRPFFLCALPIWIIAEIVAFQPNDYDNNKLLIVVYMLSCPLVAAFLINVYERLKGMGGRRILAAMTLFVLFFSGILTLIRETVSDYTLYESPHVKAARFIDENLPADAVFLTNERHNNAVASLTGRSIVQGSPSYLYYHGVYDYGVSHDIRMMLNQPGMLDALADEYNISYVYLSDYEYNDGAYDELFAHLPLVYSQSGVNIYQVNPHTDQ